MRRPTVVRGRRGYGTALALTSACVASAWCRGALKKATMSKPASNPNPSNQPQRPAAAPSKPAPTNPGQAKPNPAPATPPKPAPKR
jgi:hypothetical protein